MEEKMVSQEAVLFGISAMVGAAIALTTSHYGLSISDPSTRKDAIAVSGTCLALWISGVALVAGW